MRNVQEKERNKKKKKKSSTNEFAVITKPPQAYKNISYETGR